MCICILFTLKSSKCRGQVPNASDFPEPGPSPKAKAKATPSKPASQLCVLGFQGLGFWV